MDFGIDFHQLGQGFLGTPGDGDGAAQGDIQVGQFGARQRTGRVDAGARFVDHEVVERGACFVDELGHQLFGFAGSGAVADGDQGDGVLVNQLAQRSQASRVSDSEAGAGRW